MRDQQEFHCDGPVGRLEGVVHHPAGQPQAIALIAHPLPTMGGTMDNKVVTTLAKACTELGWVALRFNFRGVGSSAGTFDNGDGETEDVLAVAAYAQQEFGDLPLVLAGFSFGGYVQARVAQILPPRRLILAAPAVGRFAMPEVVSDSLVIHGDQDDVVPLQDVLEWARPQQLPIVVLAGAEHFFHGRLLQLRQTVLREFLGSPL